MSNKFDDYIKEQLSKEQTELPASVRSKIDEALMKLPDEPIKADDKGEETASKQDKKITSIHTGKRSYRRFTSIAAGIAFVFLFLFPNVSETYAQAIEKIPVIGGIVKVITIRNYFYQDETHELKVDVPRVENADNTELEKINVDTGELTEKLVDQFYAEMEELGKTAHGALYVDHEVITDTEGWFTLRLCVSEVKGSSDTYYRFYNYNKLTGKTVELHDIVEKDEFYKIAEDDIKRQMAERMKEDENQCYWIEGDSFGEGFVKLTPDHNFYWDKEGNLVIPFDKYEVSPGYMGTPEFTIDRELIKELIKPGLYL